MSVQYKIQPHNNFQEQHISISLFSKNTNTSHNYTKLDLL